MKGFLIGLAVGAVLFTIGLSGTIMVTDHGINVSKEAMTNTVAEVAKQQAAAQAKIDSEPLSYGSSMTVGDLRNMNTREVPKAPEKTVEQMQDEIDTLEARVAALHEEQMAKIEADLAKE